VSPLKAKPTPIRLACETLKLALPGLLKVIVCVLVKPTVTLPKLTLAGTTEICGCTPAPESEIVVGELPALLTTETLPDTLPVTVGPNCTLRLLDCPAAMVSGRVGPLMLKPVPETVACETVTTALPRFVSVTVWALVLATVTFPKMMLAGFGVSCPPVGWMPFPVKGTTLGELRVLLVSVTLPDALLMAAGANCTLRVTDCPGVRATGKLSPLMLKPPPVTLPCEIVRLAVPELVSVMVWVPVAPTATFPKLTLVGVRES